MLAMHALEAAEAKEYRYECSNTYDCNNYPHPHGEHYVTHRALLVKAKLAYAFLISITCIPSNLVALAHDLVRAVALGAALGVLAVAVDVALLVALEEVGALVGRAAAGKTLEVVVAVVRVQLLAVQAHRRVHARVSRAAECSIYTIVVSITKVRVFL